MKQFDDFKMLLKTLRKKKNQINEPIEAIFSSIQNACMPWGTSNDQIQVFPKSHPFALFFKGTQFLHYFFEGTQFFEKGL